MGIGLVQLLPGWAFIGFSQRSKISYWFFGSGSLAVHWTGLLFVQDMLGSNGVLGSPHYFVGYNLPEVTGYAGLVALVGASAFLSRLTRRGWVGRCRDFTLFAVVGVVGLIATWGNFTPLGPHLQGDPALWQHAPAEPQRDLRRPRRGAAARLVGRPS